VDADPIAARHDAVIARLADAARRDERIVGAWLQGSRADGSEDLFSDIDFGVAVADKDFDSFDKLAFVSQAAEVLVHAEPFPGLIACLLDGPAKLDFFVEPDSGVGAAPRPAVRVLVDKTDVASRIKTGWQPDAASLARQVDTILRATFQGGMWPVRLLRREQWATYAFTEMSIIVGTIVPLMLVERDVRAFARNSISRERLLTVDERTEVDLLASGVLRATADRSMADAFRSHLGIVATLGRVGRAASVQFGLEYPAAAEAELRRFFEREWPRP